MLKATLLDYHGVLDKRKFSGMISTIVEHLYSSDCGNRKTFEKEVGDRIRSMSQSYTLGLMDPKIFWSNMESEFGVDAIQAGKKYLQTIDKNEDVWKYLPELRKNSELMIILSDCPSDKAALIKGGIDLSQFDAAYFSCDYNLTKKDKDFFLLPSKEFSIGPNEKVLFVDDSSKNVEFAKHVGLQGFVYSEGRGRDLVEAVKKF